VLEGG
jgi:hypothetical protein